MQRLTRWSCPTELEEERAAERDLHASRAHAYVQGCLPISTPVYKPRICQHRQRAPREKERKRERADPRLLRSALDFREEVDEERVILPDQPSIFPRDFLLALEEEMSVVELSVEGDDQAVVAVELPIERPDLFDRGPSPFRVVPLRQRRKLDFVQSTDSIDIPIIHLVVQRPEKLLHVRLKANLRAKQTDTPPAAPYAKRKRTREKIEVETGGRRGRARSPRDLVAEKSRGSARRPGVDTPAASRTSTGEKRRGRDNRVSPSIHLYTYRLGRLQLYRQRE